MLVHMQMPVYVGMTMCIYIYRYVHVCTHIYLPMLSVVLFTDVRLFCLCLCVYVLLVYVDWVSEVAKRHRSPEHATNLHGEAD